MIEVFDPPRDDLPKPKLINPNGTLNAPCEAQPSQIDLWCNMPSGHEGPHLAWIYLFNPDPDLNNDLTALSLALEDALAEALCIARWEDT